MSLRRLPVAVVAALAVAVVAAPALDRDAAQPLPPAASKPPGKLIGVQLHPFFTDQTTQTVERELDEARRSGSNAIRIDVAWSSLERTGPDQIDEAFAERVDWVVNGARRRGLEVIAMLYTTPCWAASAPAELEQGCAGAWWERGVTAYPPVDGERFGKAAAYVARRWGDRLAALQIWNEPNNPLFLQSRNEARDYGVLLRSAYRHVKAVRPGLEVLGGSFALSDGEFLEALYEEGGIAGHYDGIAWHPYTYPFAPRARSPRVPREQSFRDGADLMRRIMRRHGDSDPQLWATEVGASSCDPRLDDRCVSEADQARWIADYIELARDMPWLRALIVYNLRDKGTDRGDIEHGFGLLRRDFEPKPALDAFRRGANRPPDPSLSSEGR